MSFVYFLRHGQAGTRSNYDSLSDTGIRQAQLLGEHLAQQGVEFRAAYSGIMRRQCLTASAVSEAYAHAGLPFPEVIASPAWNEFNLDHVYRHVAPQLAEADEKFRADYEAMLERARSDDDDIHRRWTPCDVQIMDAWIHKRYPYDGESWDQFRARIAGAGPSFNGSEGNIAVFTSAIPTAIWTGLALDIDDLRVLPLAGALYNSAITVLRVRGDELRLFSFNGVPHLPEAALRTHR